MLQGRFPPTNINTLEDDLFFDKTKVINVDLNFLTSKTSVSHSPSSGPFQASSVILLTRSQNLPKLNTYLAQKQRKLVFDRLFFCCNNKS